MAANTVASPANNGDASSPTAPLCASSPVPVVCAPLVLVVFAALLPEPPVVLLLDVAVDEDEVEKAVLCLGGEVDSDDAVVEWSE